MSGKKDQKKKVNKEGMSAAKAEDFPTWYAQVITKAELIEYYDISGCYILRPWAYSIWESIQHYLDARIKAAGVDNCYFPLLVSQSALTREKDHIADFAPEVAWVTKSGQSDMEEPVAIRPTSETIMYPAYAKWIRSHRDLPLKLNQWNNVVRWEFKAPTPFIRSREFLWQEGHTAYANKAEADEEVLLMLENYRSVYEDLLAVPVVKGRKTEKEKFAGADYTTTIEGFIPTNGRGIQAATSHSLGQNFSKMFDITFEDDKKEKKHVWQNSWGLTTRTIGVLTMVHGDDKGLVLPPRVAPIQVVIVPLHFAGKDPVPVNKAAQELLSALVGAGVRARVDNRDNVNPGVKFNQWELKGVPIRVELGPRDVENRQCVYVRRDKANQDPIPKETVALDAALGHIREALDVMQTEMFAKAKAERDAHIIKITEWSDFVKTLDGKNVLLAPYCCTKACEEDIKKRSAEEAKNLAQQGAVELTSAAKSLCIPFEQPEGGVAGHKCIACGGAPEAWCLFGRSY